MVLLGAQLLSLFFYSLFLCVSKISIYLSIYLFINLSGVQTRIAYIHRLTSIFIYVDVYMNILNDLSVNLSIYQDMSMCCQLEGYKQEQLTFIDGLLKQLGESFIAFFYRKKIIVNFKLKSI